MEFIKEYLAFEKWLKTNHLPGPSQLLWHKLFGLFNGSGWAEWVTVSNMDLMAMIQVKREASFIEYRDALIRAGLIEYRKGKKGCPNQYRYISICTFTGEVQSVVNSVVESEVQSEVQSVAETAVSYKTKTKTKTKKESMRPRFQKPAVEEVRAYCTERRNAVDAQRFVNYYESNGWRVGKNPMKDWKAAVRTWEQRDKKQKPSAATANSSLDKQELHDLIHRGFADDL